LVAVRKSIKILLFPFIIFLFILGWIFYVYGDRETSTKTVNKKKTREGALKEKSALNAGKVEMGLIIEEKVENQQT